MTPSRRLRRLATAAPFVAPWFLGFFGLTLVPVVMSAYYSLCYFDGNQVCVWIGLDNYRELFTSDPVFAVSLRNTLYMVLVALPASLAFCLGVAMLLNSIRTGMPALRAVIYLPAMMPVVAVSILWVWILNTNSGVVNQTLSSFGVGPVGWLSSPLWSKPALILMGMWGSGTTILIFYAALKQVPEALYEAAQIDGAGPWRRFLSVTLPSISPTIFFTVVTGIIGYFQYFSQAYIMTSGGPQDSTMFYALHLFNEAWLNWRMGYASAMAWILLLLTLACLALVHLGSRKWVHYR